MSCYNFEIVFTSEGGGTIGVDRAARYGYWDYPDGSEGGGLWFEATASGPLRLVDFDGAYALPRRVVSALRVAGMIVDPDFDD